MLNGSLELWNYFEFDAAGQHGKFYFLNLNLGSHFSGFVFGIFWIQCYRPFPSQSARLTGRKVETRLINPLQTPESNCIVVLVDPVSLKESWSFNTINGEIRRTIWLSDCIPEIPGTIRPLDCSTAIIPSLSRTLENILIHTGWENKYNLIERNIGWLRKKGKKFHCTRVTTKLLIPPSRTKTEDFFINIKFNYFKVFTVRMFSRTLLLKGASTSLLHHHQLPFESKVIFPVCFLSIFENRGQ